MRVDLPRDRRATNHSSDALSKAGQVMDRGGLTRAGRALDKHGGRPDSVFPKATGNPASKNMQGQYQLDDVLTNPTGSIERCNRPKYIHLKQRNGGQFLLFNFNKL